MEGAGEECMFLCAVIVQVWHWTWQEISMQGGAVAAHCYPVRVGRYYYYYWLTLCSCSLPANTLLHGHCHTKNDDGSTSTWWVRNICIVFCQWRSVIIYYLIVLFLYNIFSSAGDAYQPMKYHKFPTSRDNPRLNVLHSSVNGRIGPDNCYQTRLCQDFRLQSCSSKLPLIQFQSLISPPPPPRLPSRDIYTRSL